MDASCCVEPKGDGCRAADCCTEKNGGACCPDVNDAEWDMTEHEWTDKLFYCNNLFLLFHFPLNIGSVITRTMDEIGEKGVALSQPAMIMQKETGLFSGKIMVAVEKPMHAEEKIEAVSGRMYSKVFRGPYSEFGKVVPEFVSFLKGKGLETKNVYFWYATCPKCAERKGGLKTILLAEVVPSVG